MLKAKGILGAIAVGCILVILSLGPALAAFSIDKGTIEDQVSPGQHVKYEVNMTFSNDSTPTDYVAGVFGFGQSLDGSNMELKADLDKSAYSARPFLKVLPTAFHLEPGKSQIMTLEGDIPSDVGEGARYALIYINAPPKEKKTISFNMGLDIPVILSIKDSKIIKTGEISRMELSEPVSAKEQNLSLIFNNTGNTHYRVLAKADLKDKDGNVLKSASTKPSFASIIPPNSLLIKLVLSPEKKLESGDYSIASEVSTEDGEILATKEISFRIE